MMMKLTGVKTVNSRTLSTERQVFVMTVKMEMSSIVSTVSSIAHIPIDTDALVVLLATTPSTTANSAKRRIKDAPIQMTQGHV